MKLLRRFFINLQQYKSILRGLLVLLFIYLVIIGNDNKYSIIETKQESYANAMKLDGYISEMSVHNADVENQIDLIQNKIVQFEKKIAQFENDFDNKKNIRNEILVILHIPRTAGMHWHKLITRKLFFRSPNSSYEIGCTHGEQLIDCKFNSYNRETSDWFRQDRICNTHSGYSDLLDCIETKRKFLKNDVKIQMITFLREPIKRYISQVHYRLDNVWPRDLSKNKCSNFKLYDKNCNTSKERQDKTMQELIECEHNVAFNMQVRMLADYDDIGCHSLHCWMNQCPLVVRVSNEKKLLESAKQTLVSMKFFGLTEYQELSEYLFEKSFNDKYKISTTTIDPAEWKKVSWDNFIDKMNVNVKETFREPLNQSKISELINEAEANSVTSEEYKNIPKEFLEKIKEKNRLDIALYEFAKELFFQRVRQIYYSSND